MKTEFDYKPGNNNFPLSVFFQRFNSSDAFNLPINLQTRRHFNLYAVADLQRED